jgi:hemolysin activation/secretion protein
MTILTIKPLNRNPLMVPLLIIFLLVLCPGLSFAGGNNVGGDIERTLPKKKPDKPGVDAAISSPSEVDDFDVDIENQTRVLIKAVSFKGNTLVSSESLQAIVDSYLNKELSLRDFDQMRLDVIALYRKMGYWATAIFDEQDITNSDVVLTVYEGRVGKVTLKAEDGVRFSSARAKKFIERQQAAGQPIQINVLDQSVANLDAVPGVNASLELKEGEAEGETDIIVNTTSAPMLSGGIVADNFGSRSTGYKRATLSLSVNSLFNQGEQINIQRLKTGENLDFYALSASYPLLNDGTQISYAYTNMDYLLGAPYKSLNADGESHTQTLSISTPVDMPSDISANIKLDYSVSDYLNLASDVKTSDNQVKTWAATLNLAVSDNFLGGGYNNLAAILKHGDVNLEGDAVNFASDSATARTHGQFDTVNINYTRIQSLLPSTKVWWTLSAQQALNRNLDSSQKMSLGGATGVRAYPSSEASGDIGLVSQLELRHQLTANLETKLFYDFGYIQQYKKTYADWNSANAGMPNCYELQGVGLGLQWQAFNNTTLLANVATKVGSNAGERNGADNDGTDKNTRAWVSMTVTF